VEAARTLAVGLLAALGAIGGCGTSTATTDDHFCDVAASDRLRGLARLDFADTDEVAAARSQLALLRSAAPGTLRRDLTRLLDGIDDLEPGASADDLAPAAHRVERYLRDTCGIAL
jgi:hypothetical protein